MEMKQINMNNMSAPEAAGCALGGCLLVILIWALCALTITPLIVWLAWNVCVVGVLAPIFHWTLPLLTYWQLVAAGLALSLLGGFFRGVTTHSSS